jgi:hypothetical protein
MYDSIHRFCDHAPTIVNQHAAYSKRSTAFGLFCKSYNASGGFVGSLDGSAANAYSRT